MLFDCSQTLFRCKAILFILGTYVMMNILSRFPSGKTPVAVNKHMIQK